MDISIKITDRKGKTHKVKVPTDMGLNMMQVIQAYEFEPVGTVGMCGGKLMCRTCQCYVKEEANLPEKTEAEKMSLSRLLHLQPNSRLSCQIPVVPDLEGLEIQLAPYF